MTRSGPCSSPRRRWCRSAARCCRTPRGCCGSCSSTTGAFAPDADAAEKNLGADAAPVLEAALSSLDALKDWTAPEIEAALKGALVDGLGLKPRKAFAPVRVAVTGRTVSPPLYESMELLGRERSLGRLRAGFERAGAVG